MLTIEKVMAELNIGHEELFERAYTAIKGSLIDREQTAAIERSVRAYKRSGTIPEYVQEWLPRQLGDVMVGE